MLVLGQPYLALADEWRERGGGTAGPGLGAAIRSGLVIAFSSN